ncbi:hypothetical protein V5799_004261 [Amblyomma americanum]|uniref:HSF-type DNA-binding domain-containing protein n=1 Tax=Amblyomma americanum TaxID=6943 RepID=A0AAQ4D6M1_AMBAM
MHPYEDYKFQLSKESSMSFVRFPKKLWKIVNECNSGAISWSPDGKAVVIEYDKFQKQYLNGQREMFKTNNINSFIRQLNLYGFRKVSSHYKVICANQHGGADVHVFRNAAFLRGRPELLSRVTRKSGLMRPKALQHEDDDDSANLLPRHNRRGHGTDAGVRGVSAQVS